MKTIILSDEISAKNTWWIWLFCCLVTLVLQFLTLEFDPLILQDEVQILDFGRTVWDPDSDSALSWNVSESSPVLAWTTVGNSLQEIAYRLSAPSLLGPRLMSMFAGLVAATSLLGWLLARHTPRVAAIVISLAFLLDPIFSDIYRRGRIDGWAIAACLTACWLLCLSRERRKAGEPIRVQVTTAGFLTGLSPFLWATAPMLFPLVLLEFYYLVKAEILRGKAGLAKGISPVILFFMIGGLSAGSIALLPLLTHWDSYWSSMMAAVAIQARAAVIQNSVLDLLLVHDPLIFLTAIAAFMIRRELGILIGLVLAYFLMMRTMVYLPRVLYLLPYFAVIIAGATTVMRDTVTAPRRKILITTMLSLLLAWNLGTVLLMRPMAAMEQRPTNDPVQIFRAFNEVIGPGPFRVLLEEWEGYYAARQLSWKIFRAGSPTPREEYLEFVKTMEYVIIRDASQSATPQLSAVQLESAGFELKKVIQFTQTLDGVMESSLYPDLLVYRKAE